MSRAVGRGTPDGLVGDAWLCPQFWVFREEMPMGQSPIFIFVIIVDKAPLIGTANVKYRWVVNACHVSLAYRTFESDTVRTLEVINQTLDQFHFNLSTLLSCRCPQVEVVAMASARRKHLCVGICTF